MSNTAAATVTTPTSAGELARITRAAQGLPPTIEDPSVLARIARVLTRASST